MGHFRCRRGRLPRACVKLRTTRLSLNARSTFDACPSGIPGMRWSAVNTLPRPRVHSGLDPQPHTRDIVFVLCSLLVIVSLFSRFVRMYVLPLSFDLRRFGRRIYVGIYDDRVLSPWTRAIRISCIILGNRSGVCRFWDQRSRTR